MVLHRLSFRKNDRLYPRLIKKDFPIFEKNEGGKRLVYLDSAASTQKPKRVIEAIKEFYEREYANIHRGVYFLSQHATARYDCARKIVANFIGLRNENCLIFTKGTTDSINLVAQCFGRHFLREGDEIILNPLEHHSNLVPWQMLAKEKKIRLRFIPLTDDDRLDLDAYVDMLSDRTKLVCVAHMSNVTGTIHPIKTIIDWAHRKGAKVLIDGAQGASHLKVNVEELDCDFYAMSAHKMLGPTGVGALYAKEEILKQMPPYQGGGDMIHEVFLEDFRPASIPMKFEAGTPNIVGVIGFGEAVNYIQSIGMEKIRQHEIELTRYCVQKLDQFDFIEQMGPRDWNTRGGICSFIVRHVHPHDVGTILDHEGVCIRAGHHCAQPYMRLRGIAGTNRASFHLYNTKEDIDALIDALQRVQEVFGHVLGKRSI